MLLAACFIISLAFSLWLYVKQGRQLNAQVKEYAATEATIIQVYPPRMSRVGMKPPRYGISFKASNGRNYIKYNCELGGKFKTGDRVAIYYNPGNPDDEVVTQR